MTVAILYTLSNTYGALEFDTVMGENHSASASPTTHPVENGVDITDHIRVELDRVSFEGVITNTPLVDVSQSTFIDPNGVPRRRVAALRGAKASMDYAYTIAQRTQTGRLDGAFSVPVFIPGAPRLASTGTYIPSEFADVAQKLTGTPLQFGAFVDRTKEAFEVLRRLLGQEVSLSTSLKEYSSMAITRVGAPRTTPHGMVFSLELQQLRKVSSRTTSVAISKTKPAESRAKDKVDEGPKVTYAPTLGEAERAKTFYARGVDGVARAITE
jgi:hypothetical protein